jgi:hypothetical protein
MLLVKLDEFLIRLKHLDRIELRRGSVGALSRITSGPARARMLPWRPAHRMEDCVSCYHALC